MTWPRESRRHALAARGISSRRTCVARGNGGEVSPLVEIARKYDNKEDFLKEEIRNVWFHSTDYPGRIDKFNTSEVWFECCPMPGYGDRTLGIHYVMKKPFVALQWDFEKAEDWGVSKEQSLANIKLYEELGGEINPGTFEELRKLGYDSIVNDEGYAALYPERVTVVEQNYQDDTRTPLHIIYSNVLIPFWEQAHGGN